MNKFKESNGRSHYPSAFMHGMSWKLILGAWGTLIFGAVYVSFFILIMILPSDWSGLLKGFLSVAGGLFGGISIAAIILYNQNKDH